jgi:hypothetical protein
LYFNKNWYNKIKKVGNKNGKIIWKNK